MLLRDFPHLTCPRGLGPGFGLDCPSVSRQFEILPLRCFAIFSSVIFSSEVPVLLFLRSRMRLSCALLITTLPFTLAAQQTPHAKQPSRIPSAQTRTSAPQPEALAQLNPALLQSL